MRRRWLRIAPVLLAVAVSYLAGCSKNPVAPRYAGYPQTELTYAPLESDTSSFRVHLYWQGYDRDGEVVRFRFAIDSDTLRPPAGWRATTAHDSEFTFTVAPGDFVGGHVFWVVAEDNRGLFDPTPAKRFFSIRTDPPTSQITGGPLVGAATGSTVTFSWDGTDPDGGPTGNAAPADSFEYMLLRPGASYDGSHTPLPDGSRFQDYVDLLNAASGSSLPAPYDDWKWIGTSTRSKTLTDLIPGLYLFAVRAVDAAGAHDANLQLNRNVRYFYVASTPDRQSPPQLTITSDVLTGPLSSYDPGIVAGDPIFLRIPILDGVPVSFSWTGAPGASGSPLAGFTSAIGDTTSDSWSHPDLSNTRLTLPTDLTPGIHYLFIRVVDVSGGSSIAVLMLEVTHAAFRDPGQPSSILYVDDFAAPPGDWASALRGSPNYPTDPVEDDWWTRIILAPLAREFGVSFEQSDAVLEGSTSIYGRTGPTLQELARHRVVVWSVDLTNSGSTPTGLWTALFGDNTSALRTYLRGGGTLIVTGFRLAENTSKYSDVPYSSYAQGMCATLDQGGLLWNGAYFQRDFMALDGALASAMAARTYGARDFIEARVTPRGSALGFDSAALDVGDSGAKWDSMAFQPTLSPDTRNVRLAPGLPAIDGLRVATSLGCNADENGYRRESPGLPIASPVFTYHGVNMGLLEDGGPSPREGLVVGIATQAHDDGRGDGSLVTPGNAVGVTGRMVFLGFPIYYMRDTQAYAVMRAAFAYVNGSPTLPQGGP